MAKDIALDFGDDKDGKKYSNLDYLHAKVITEKLDSLKEVLRGIVFVKIVVCLCVFSFSVCVFLGINLNVIGILSLIFLTFCVINLFILKRDKKFIVKDLKEYVYHDSRFRNVAPFYRRHPLIKKHVRGR